MTSETHRQSPAETVRPLTGLGQRGRASRMRPHRPSRVPADRGGDDPMTTGKDSFGLRAAPGPYTVRLDTVTNHPETSAP